MAYENNNAFSDWLYNRYVEALRNSDITRQVVFFDTMNQYLNRALYQRRFSAQKRYLNNLLKTIQKAHKSSTVQKLQLTGDEWQMEYKRTMEDYEKSLREMGFDEERITELIIEKKYSYGNE